MKIAVVTEDGKMISQHFGRAPMFVVFTIEDRKVVSRETRAKVGHNGHGRHEGEPKHHNIQGKGQGAHANMIANILDCQIVIAGGMGARAHANLELHHIQPILTDKKEIEEAVEAFIDGSLEHISERLH